MCQTVKVSVTNTRPTKALWATRICARVAASVHLSGGILLPQKEDNLFVYKEIFCLPWMHHQTLGYYLCTHISHPKQPLKPMDFFPFWPWEAAHENIQSRKHLCKHLQQGCEITLKTHKTGSHFQTHYFLGWRMLVNDRLAALRCRPTQLISCFTSTNQHLRENQLFI